jgi:hypothetical protein
MTLMKIGRRWLNLSLLTDAEEAGVDVRLYFAAPEREDVGDSGLVSDTRTITLKGDDAVAIRRKLDALAARDAIRLGD